MDSIDYVGNQLKDMLALIEGLLSLSSEQKQNLFEIFIIGIIIIAFVWWYFFIK